MAKRMKWVIRNQWVKFISFKLKTAFNMMAKFDQDEFSKKALLATKKLNLIEANPNDNQWGGHCSLQDDFTKATGLNKQGKLLMEVRNTLSN
ncbi:NADAR family protein [Lactobacillus crispatus]|uniref:NADAR family protein n=2 Tax=Lactobacillus crispatus TaxID=47770 RepID=A0A4Q0LRG8_9LACO|nr:NADAR family protein [Lactobacillus crispatus]